MDAQIAAFLAQDGITTGAIYALLALALVLVFAVTRVIFIPQGEFVAYGALTLAMIQAGQAPATLWLLTVLGALASALDAPALWRRRRWPVLGRMLAWRLGWPLAAWLLLSTLPLPSLPMPLQIALALAVVTPMGPLLHRLVYQPIASASVLILLITSMAVHVAMAGLGLLFFGAEGQRTPPFSEARFAVADWMQVSGQTLWVVCSSLALIAALYVFFERSLYGKVLRATAYNRVGARLMGFSPVLAGRLTFSLSALIGALSGVLIAPITTIYYDTGFLIALKGFVGAIIGGLASYPVAAAGALAVGLLESYASFWASTYKEIIVFTLIIPVLLWRSLRSHHLEDEE